MVALLAGPGIRLVGEGGGEEGREQGLRVVVFGDGGGRAISEGRGEGVKKRDCRLGGGTHVEYFARGVG